MIFFVSVFGKNQMEVIDLILFKHQERGIYLRRGKELIMGCWGGAINPEQILRSD